MDFQDLDALRAIRASLMECFVAHTGGKADPVALERVERLCDAGMRTLDDLECRVALRGVKSYAALLFSDDGHVGIDSGGFSGIDFLRLRIHNALSELRGRLDALEVQRLQQQQAEFELRQFRRIEPAALAAGAGAIESVPHSGLRVLVVEDNRDAAESLRRLLYHCGYEVAVAFTGQEGLRTARLIRPHVVLCDIGLPDSNGFVVAAALRKEPETARARLIAVTAYGQEEDRRRALEAGFDVHLVKPVDPDVLLGKLKG